MNQSNSKTLYRALVDNEPRVPLFSRDWWLDAVAGGENWDVALVERGGEIIAAMPYVQRKRFGYTVLTQPSLTQHLGPWLRPAPSNGPKRLAREKDVMQALIDQLPVFDFFRQSWHHSLSNWLPFYWRGFTQTTRYTYVLPRLDAIEGLWRGLRENIRTDIRKAQGRKGLTIRSDVELNEFLELNDKTFARQGRHAGYSRELVRRLDEACHQRSCRRIFVAEDSGGRRHAAAYVVWDENSAYYLLAGSDPALRGSGAGSFCLWEAIKFAATVTTAFDFEGSMNEAIERHFRAFGAVQTPYFSIEKCNNRALLAALHLRDATRCLVGAPIK